MSKSLQDQLKVISKQINKDSQKSYTIYDLFSDDFLKSVSITENIESIFESADVDISTFPNIFGINYINISNIVARYGFNSWDDFLDSAKKYQSLKQLKAKGYSIT